MAEVAPRRAVEWKWFLYGVCSKEKLTPREGLHGVRGATPNL